MYTYCTYMALQIHKLCLVMNFIMVGLLVITILYIVQIDASLFC